MMTKHMIAAAGISLIIAKKSLNGFVVLSLCWTGIPLNCKLPYFLDALIYNNICINSELND